MITTLCRRPLLGALAVLLLLSTRAMAQTPLSGATAIALGDLHACAVVNGGVKCWGFNASGQLGNGVEVTYPDSPEAIVSIATDVVGLPAGSGVTALAAGVEHTCALKADQSVLCWGRGSEGQLGTGIPGALPTTTPQQVVGLGPGSGATAIAAGQFFTCAVVQGGVFCWGDVPDASDAELDTPQQLLPPGAGATAVAARQEHACAVVNAGVLCWGQGSWGRLGDGTTATTAVPVTAIPQGSGATAVAAGDLHTCAIVAGALECWGLNNAGQLATGVLGDGQYSPVPVAATAFAGVPARLSLGWGHACAIVNGGVRCWGGDFAGSLGAGSAWVFSATAAPVDVVGLGPGSGATDVSAGLYFSCAVVAGGVQCWGYGDFGELGNGGVVSSAVPVAVVTDDPVVNTAPVVGPIAITPSALVPVGTTIAATAAVEDPDAGDVLACSLAWGDGSGATALPMSGSCGGTHAYTEPGVYLVTISAIDAAGASDSESFAYVVVYDPSSGFVTGGGFFDSVPGAYRPDASLGGWAHFGFVAKYQAGRSVPSGQTEFQFAAAGFTFRSASYEWLVVGGAKAIYRGVGTVNGGGDYAFQVTAIDGDLQGTGVDRMRVRIWDRATGEVVYDNQTCGATDDNADACTALAAGNVVVHTAKK